MIKVRRDWGQGRGGSRSGVVLRRVCLSDSTLASLSAEVEHRLEPGVRGARSNTELGLVAIARMRRWLVPIVP